MDYNFTGIPKQGYNFSGIPKAVQAKPVPIEKPEGIYRGFIKPTAKDIGGGFKDRFNELGEGIDIEKDPFGLHTKSIGQAATALGIGMGAFAEDVSTRVITIAKQLWKEGKIDWEAVKLASDKLKDLPQYKMTDPLAKTITDFVSVIPVGVKTAFDELAEPFKESSPNIYAGLKTIGDIGELAAFGEVFRLGKLKGKDAVSKEYIQKVEKLDSTFAKNEILTRIAEERASTKQRPLEILARKEESLKAKPPEPTAREIKQTELEETFKDYNFEGIPKETSVEKVQPEPRMKEKLKPIYKKIMDSFPEDIRKDINAESINIVKFPGEYEGTGGRVEIRGKIHEPSRYHVFIEKGEPLEETLRHELLHTYILKHPELADESFFGQEKAIDNLEKELLKKSKEEKPTGTAQGKAELVEKTRSVKDIAKDINTALGKRGSIEIGDLNPEQEAAILRLKGDIENIKSEAKKVGKTVEKYLLDKRYDPQTAYLLHKYADELPKYARSINLQRQDIPEDYKAFEATLLDPKPKKTQTWEESEKLAGKYMKDVKTKSDLFTKAKKGTLPLTTEKLLAMRQINVNAIEGLKRVVEMDDPALAKQALESYRDNIGHVMSDTSSEVGRMLNIHKKEVAINNLGRALTELEKDLNPRQFEELKNLNLEDPVMVQNFIKNLKDPKLSDYFLEYWYNAILSGPPTHVVNITGNTAWVSFQVPQRGLTGIVDIFYSKLTGKKRQFYVNEILPMLAGYKKGFKKGKTTAMEVLRTGKAQKFEDKWYQELDFSMGAWRRSPNKLIRKVAPLVDVPTRALRAMDIWANAIAYDGEISSIIRRMSNEKGLKGKERAKFEIEAHKNITEEMHEAAKVKALNSTFMDEPDPFTQYVISARNIPVIGPVLRVTIIPFVNTISNLTKRGVELTPGLGIAKEAISRGMGRGMPTPKLISKQIMGSVLAFYVINKAAEGRITGPMPESKGEREAWYRMGKKPWSIKIGGVYNKETNEIDGGEWYQYRRFEPYNTPIAGAAMAYEEIKAAMDKGDEKTATEHFGHFADQMKNNVIDGSYLSGLQQTLDKYGGRKGAIPRWLASWMPYSSFFRSINRSIEVLTDGEAKPREGNEWLKSFSSVIPGLSGKMPAKLTVWGEESVIPGGVFHQWLPFKWSQETNDPVEKELARLDFYPMLPRQTVSYRGKDVKLPDDVYRDYCIDYGQELKNDFAFRIGREGWDSRPPEVRKKLLEKIRNKSGLKARRNLVRNYLSKNGE